MARAGDGITIRAREREVDVTVTLTYRAYPEQEHGQTADEQIRESIERLGYPPDQVDVETSNAGPWR